MPPLLTEPMPIAGAVEAFSRRAAVLSPATSTDWDKVAVGLRQKALWSAGVEHAKFVATAQAKLLQALRDERATLDNGKTVNMDQRRFVRDMRSLVLQARASGELPQASGTPLKDIGDATRLRLIFDMNTRMAQGEARWRRQQDPDVLNMWPAQELTSSSANQPRPEDYWHDRWLTAAQESGDFKAGEILDETGRYVALKTSPIWVALSRFGVPWPPFDYGSQRRLRNVTREDAIEIGLLEADKELEPIEEQFDTALQVSTTGMNKDSVSLLQQLFGDQLDIDGDTISWSGRAAA